MYRVAKNFIYGVGDYIADSNKLKLRIQLHLTLIKFKNIVILEWFSDVYSPYVQWGCT